MLDKDKRLAWTKKKLYGGLLVITLVAGILGGVIVSAFSRQHPESQDRPNPEILLPEGGLLFKSKEGKLVAKLDADDGGGLLIIYNASEKPIITMGGSTYGGGGLIGITSGKGLGAVLGLAGHEEGGSIVLYSQNRGKRVVRLFADDDGGSISVNGPTGDEAVTIDTDELGSAINGRIQILESRSGKLLWTLPTGTPTKK